MGQQNGARNIITWNRLAGARGEGGRGDWIKKVKRLPKEHQCRLHRQRQQWGEGQGRGR